MAGDLFSRPVLSIRTARERNLALTADGRGEVIGRAPHAAQALGKRLASDVLDGEHASVPPDRAPRSLCPTGIARRLTDMRKRVTKRGQVSAPFNVRRKLQIGPATVRAFRGSGPGGQVAALLRERKRDRQREDV